MALRREQLELQELDGRASQLLGEVRRMQEAERLTQLELRALKAEAEKRRLEGPRGLGAPSYGDDWIPHGIKSAG